MTCQECERLLGEGERPAHIEQCAECAALAAELDANARAFSAMREEAIASRPRAARGCGWLPLPRRRWWLRSD